MCAQIAKMIDEIIAAMLKYILSKWTKWWSGVRVRVALDSRTAYFLKIAAAASGRPASRVATVAVKLLEAALACGAAADEFFACVGARDPALLDEILAIKRAVAERLPEVIKIVEKRE